ncbi:adenylosuccinate synthetase [Parasediminibacterium sp. JCM 36343]|uniref:adenylosuccinate synthetase n=1 Tax=Parasediminibacterium sp. JCM 36343 TaxID=3374279 RepID=UPI003978034A
MAQRKIILLLSGEIAAGKSTLSKGLENTFAFKVLKTREVLKEIGNKKLSGKKPERNFFQKLGESLDSSGGGKWVLDNFNESFSKTFSEHNLYVVDSVRILKQIECFRKAYSYSVFHIHLVASKKILERRFYQRNEFESLTQQESEQKYIAAKKDKTEAQVNTLEEEADLVIDSERCTKEDVLIRVASFFKLLAPTKNELVDVIVGGQFGSEGKGQIAGHIAPFYDCLMRVGGPNAGHTVYEEPAKHVFHLLPSGTWRNQNAKILLGPGTVINANKLLEEIAKYKVEDEFSRRLFIDENAIIISENDISEEEKVKKTIGSTAQGVGYATSNNILARLNADDKHKAKYNNKLKPFIGNTAQILEDMYRNNKKILLEGTQGSGLSLHHGIYPYVTSRDTSVSGCLSEAGISPKRVNKIIMVTRTYPIRVGGTSGTFVSQEIDMETVAKRSGKNAEELIQKEKTTTTKIDRRIAEFSWEMFRRGCELNSPTDIALTFTDYISIKNEKARRYDQLTSETRQLIEEIERCSGVKVSLIGIGFDYRAIIDRRNWK